MEQSVLHAAVDLPGIPWRQWESEFIVPNSKEAREPRAADQSGPFHIPHGRRIRSQPTGNGKTVALSYRIESECGTTLQIPARHDWMKPIPSRSFVGAFAILGYAVFCLIFVAFLSELTCWLIWSALHRGPYPFEGAAATPVYAHDPHAAEYWRDEAKRFKQHRPYVPFTVWGVLEWHSRYMNADATETGIWRRTINPRDSECQQEGKSNVWVFGGSTVYGQFVPDWATLPSYLSKVLNTTQDRCVIVHNLGVEGYVTNQEVILLMQQLKTGQHPDVVIFYDGVNEPGTALEGPDPALAHGSFGNIKARVEGSLSGRLDFLRESYTWRLVSHLTQHFGWRRRSQPLGADYHGKAAAVMDNYEANMKLARALSLAYKFNLYCFWQPILLYGQKPPVPFEQELITRDTSGDSAYRPWLRITVSVYQEAERRASKGDDFVFLGGLFDSVKESLYVDEVHPGPLGNELAAEAVAKYIRDPFLKTRRFSSRTH